MLAVMQRELKSYFSGVTAYVFSAFMLVFVGIFVMMICLNSGYSNFEWVLENVSFVFLIIMPILTMRVLAEERHSKTDQLLYSLPITVGQIVLGKYLAMVAVIAFPCAIMALYPLQLTMFGNVSLSMAYSMLLAFFLLGVSLASIGMFISSMTESQVSAAVICLLVLLLLYFMKDLTSYVPSSAFASLVAMCVLMLLFGAVMFVFTRNPAFSLGVAIAGLVIVMGLYLFNSGMFAGLFPSIMQKIGPFERFQVFGNGIFDLTSVVYFLSVSAVFLFFTVQTLERRRWS